MRRPCYRLFNSWKLFRSPRARRVQGSAFGGIGVFLSDNLVSVFAGAILDGVLQTNIQTDVIGVRTETSINAPRYIQFVQPA